VNEDVHDAVQLGRLREAGLITYPSPLLGGLLNKLPEVLVKEVLPRLDCLDRTMLAQVGRPWRKAVRDSGLPRAPQKPEKPLNFAEFCTSVDRLAWAKANRCPWSKKDLSSHTGNYGRNACALAAQGGHLEVLKWARAHGCPWDDETYSNAARGGHLEVLKYAWEHDCPWFDRRYMCDNTVYDGHLEVLKWALEHDCEWEDIGPGDDYAGDVCEVAAAGGHLEVLKWAREQDYPWDRDMCAAVCQSHPETLAWVQQQPDSDSSSSNVSNSCSQ
jgi:hypothetical protein